MKRSLILATFLCISAGLFAQTIKLEKNNLEPNKVYMSLEKLNGKDVVTISTTDIAPTLLKNFNVAVPSYMKKGINLFS